MTTIEAARDGVKRWIRQLREAVDSGELTTEAMERYNLLAYDLEHAVEQATAATTEPAPYRGGCHATNP